jgi:hypothetical protein
MYYVQLGEKITLSAIRIATRFSIQPGKSFNFLTVPLYPLKALPGHPLRSNKQFWEKE